MSAKPQEDFFKSRSFGFGSFTEKDDFLHPNQICSGDSCTETQYFGFYVPKANIYAFCYFWLHPNINCVMGGLAVCQGLKRSHLQAELFDFNTYLSKDTVIKNDLHSYRLPNSYQVDVLEPGKKMRLRYDDPVRQNRLDLSIAAMMPPAMRANNRHFEQAMKYEGELTLRGQKHQVDCYNVRDRSWGELRPEEALPFPPMTWTTGIFGDNFAFNCSAFDHPDYNPITLKEFPISAEQAFNDGWVFRDGQLAKIKSVKKLTMRDPETGRPLSHVMDMVDVDNREYHITGTITAGLPFGGWLNLYTHLCLTKWECEGMTGWGDTQDLHWTDFERQFTKAY
jgi:hypothetical protein